jgi:hypothetical protein
MSQSLQSFQGLALRVNFDDRLRIEDQSGVRTTGRLTDLTRDEIAIRTGSGEQRFTSADVRAITIRRAPRRKSILVGAAAGAVAGALAGCAGQDRQECADAPILLGGVGAGVGLALSALMARATTVYPSPIDVTPSREAAELPGPLDDLALRVNLDDRLRVEDISGARITGRLTSLTGNEMTIDTGAGEKHYTSDQIRAVAVRSHRLVMGAIIGAVSFPALLAASPHCRSDSDCMPVAAAPFGAGVGLAVGALIPRMRTVFRTEERRAWLSPEISRGTIGIRVSMPW